MSSPLNGFFTSAFIVESPQFLLTNYNEKLIKSLLSLIGSAEKTLHLNFAEIQTRLSAVDPSSKFSPKIYSFHALLQKAIKQGVVTSSLYWLKQIELLLVQNEIYAPSFIIQTVSSEIWEQTILNDLKTQNPFRDGSLPSLFGIEEAEIQKVQGIVLESIKLLLNASPLFYKEFETYVASLKFFSSNMLIGMTDVRVFGSIYLCWPRGDIPENVYFCEHIIHETSHLHLHTLFAIDQLILNSPSERYKAPIRPDLRPMYGIFHATFVLSRMVRLFMELTKDNGPVFEEHFEQFLKQFLNGYNTIKEFGKLTPLGWKIMESYSDITSMRPTTTG